MIKKINSIDKCSHEWYKQEKYDLKYKKLDLQNLYWNIVNRLQLFRPYESLKKSYDESLVFNEFLDSGEPILKKYLEPSDDNYIFDIPQAYSRNFEEIIDKAIFIMDENQKDYYFEDLIHHPASLGITGKKLHLPGVHPLAYWEINEEVERIDCLIENNPNFLEGTNGLNYKKVNSSEINLAKLARKIEPGYKNQFFHSFDLNLFNEIEKLSRNNRNFIHDYLFTLNPREDKRIVDMRIDLAKSDKVLKDSFKKLIASLRKELNIDDKEDNILVNKDEHTTKIVRTFVKYRVFEFFDLTFWSMITNKRYTRDAMSEILFKDRPNSCIRTLLDKTIDLIKIYFIHNGDGLKSIESQTRADLKYRSFSSINK